jgi:pimeloyl-ACP methyl ester carboxylesterase
MYSNNTLIMPRLDTTENYDVAGPKNAGAIVFVHGIRLTRATWSPQLAALANDFRVIALDLPGHGALARVQFSIGAAVRHIADVITAEARGPALLVGLSTGGYIALEACSRHPRLVRGLVLAGCSADIDGLIRVSFEVAGWLFRWTPHRLLRVLDTRRMQRLCGQALGGRIADAGFFYDAAPSVIDALLKMDHCRDKLKACLAPVLVLNGGKDFAFRRREKEFVANARDAATAVIPGAKHLSNLHSPAAFNAAIRRFAAAV